MERYLESFEVIAAERRSGVVIEVAVGREIAHGDAAMRRALDSAVTKMFGSDRTI